MPEATTSVSAAEKLICQHCGIHFKRQVQRGPKPKKCPACAGPKKRAGRARSVKNRQAAAREQAAPTIGQRSFECQFCFQTLIAAPVGKKPKSCQSCRRVRENEARRVASGTSAADCLTIIHCSDCKLEVRINYSWSRGQFRCDPCQTKADRRVGRHSRHRRRAAMTHASAERFTDLEIYQRDRWMCGICKKRISQRALWPDRMAATIDHLIPVSQGGPHTRANVRAAHYSCNSARSNRGGGEQLMLIG